MRAWNHDFQGHKRIVSEIESEDRAYAVSAWFRLARIQAKASLYDEALATVEMVPESDSHAAMRKYTLQAIEECREQKSKPDIKEGFGAESHGLNGYLEQLRQAAGIFSEPIVPHKSRRTAMPWTNWNVGLP